VGRAGGTLGDYAGLDEGFTMHFSNGLQGRFWGFHAVVLARLH